MLRRDPMPSSYNPVPSTPRLAAFEIFIDRLGAGVPLEPRQLDPEIEKAAAQLFDL